MYYGEANVYQEDLDSFLAIAEEIQLKGLTGLTTTDLVEEQEKMIHKRNDEAKKSTTCQIDLKPKANALNTSGAVAIPCAGLQVLDEEVKSMMEKGQKMIPRGKQNETSRICKVCGKEGLMIDKGKRKPLLFHKRGLVLGVKGVNKRRIPELFR